MVYGFEIQILVRIYGTELFKTIAETVIFKIHGKPLHISILQRYPIIFF